MVYDSDLQVNNLLSSWVPGPTIYLPSSQGQKSLKFQIEGLPHNSDSRRAQYLTQPPCTEVYGWITIKEGQSSSSQTCFSAHDKDGVKLGRLLEELEAAKNEQLALIRHRAERRMAVREKRWRKDVEIPAEWLGKFEEAHALLVIESTTK